MTREEAYNKLEKLMKEKDEIHTNIYAYVEFNQADDLIEKIYEDFENRICKNCRFYDNVYNTCNSIKNTKMLGFTLTEIDENFGCNKFERK